MFKFLSQLNESNKSKISLNSYKSELSLQAKKEYLIKKLNSSSIEWDTEM